MLGPEDSKYGAVETREEAQKCAELFRANRDQIDGIIVTLAEFRRRARHRRDAAAGRTQRAGAGAGHAGSVIQDDDQVRRDSFCGKMSVCNNLTPVRHPLFADHAAHRSAGFRSLPQDLAWFAAVCRVVQGPAQGAHRRHRRAPGRLQHGALQREDSGGSTASPSRPSISPRSSAASTRMTDDDDAAQAKLAAIKSYVPTDGIPRRGADEDGQARRRGRRLDEGNRRRHQRRAVLDLAWRSTSAWCPAP